MDTSSSISCSTRASWSTLFVGILAFATVVTLGVPLLERDGLDDRLKSVAAPARGIARHAITPRSTPSAARCGSSPAL